MLLASEGLTLVLRLCSFELSVERSGGEIAVENTGERPFTARHPGRADCADNEVTYTEGPGAPSVLRNTAQFNGKLAYLKVYA